MNKKCQVFTPENYVMELLDIVGYKHNLYGKKILENSCGDGNILVAVVQRYIDDCVMNGLSKINQVDWKIFKKNYLRWDENIQFQYIVGNPPYITYRELKKKEQLYVKNNFETCVDGKFDYCYAFIEKSIILFRVVFSRQFLGIICVLL